MTRDRELAHRVQIEHCGQTDHMHLVLYDDAGQAFADATLGIADAEGFIENLRKMLYNLAVMRDDP